MLENSNLLFRPWASNLDIELEDVYNNVKKLNQDYVSKCPDNSTNLSILSPKAKIITDADKLKQLLSSSSKKEIRVKNVKENSSTPASSSAETRLINSKIAALSSASQLFSLDTYNSFNPNANTQIAAAVAASQVNPSSHLNCGAIPINFVFSPLSCNINKNSAVDSYNNIDPEKKFLYNNLNSISNPSQVLPSIKPTQCIPNLQVLNQSIMPHNLPQIMPQPLIQQSVLPAITSPEKIAQKIYPQPISIINSPEAYPNLASQLPILPIIQPNLTQVSQSQIEPSNYETTLIKNWNEILSPQTSNQHLKLENTIENSTFKTQSLLSDNSHFSSNLLTHEGNINNLDTQNQLQASKKIRPKKFPCDVSLCYARFSNKGQLKAHFRKHTGEKPFACDQPNCGKRFSRNEELTRHKKIHTGLKPFSCDICGKKFGRKDHLKKHIRTHQRAATQQQFSFPLMSTLNQYLYLKI